MRIAAVGLLCLIGCDDAADRLAAPAAPATAMQVAAQPVLGAPPADHPAWNPKTNVGVWGPGCPATNTNLLPYHDGFDIIVPEKPLILKGLGGRAEVLTQDCYLTIELTPVKGWQHALRRVRVVGTQTLGAGTSRALAIDLGQSGKGTRTDERLGGAANNANARFGLTYDAQPYWSACEPGGPVPKFHTIDTSVVLGLVGAQSGSARLERIMVDFTWRRCTP